MNQKNNGTIDEKSINKIQQPTLHKNVSQISTTMKKKLSIIRSKSTQGKENTND